MVVRCWRPQWGGNCVKITSEKCLMSNYPCMATYVTYVLRLQDTSNVVMGDPCPNDSLFVRLSFSHLELVFLLMLLLVWSLDFLDVLKFLGFSQAWSRAGAARIIWPRLSRALLPSQYRNAILLSSKAAPKFLQGIKIIYTRSHK